MPSTKKTRREDIDEICALPRKKFCTRLLPIPSAPVQIGQVLVCGLGLHGQLGLDNVWERKTPAAVPNLDMVVSVCAGGTQTACITKDGEVLTFGSNVEGGLGRPTISVEDERTPNKVILPEKTVQISAGDTHMAALLADGRVYVWGTFLNKHSGSDKINFPTQILNDDVCVQIASGWNHLVILTQIGDIYILGCISRNINKKGNQTYSENTLEQNNNKEGNQTYSENTLEQNNNQFFPTPVLLSKKRYAPADKIWTGIHSTFIQSQRCTSLYVYGLNNSEQLGLQQKYVEFPKLSECFNDKKWKHIAAGLHHTLALDEAGLCYTLGVDNTYGQLGLETASVYTKQLIAIPSLQDVKCVHVSCGSKSSFAVTDDGKIYSWGTGTNGELGTGLKGEQSTPTVVLAMEKQNVIDVSSGREHTVFLAKPTCEK